ncbi:MAG: hypothetical protein Fur007_05570 [Rhodoferax sp.]
MGLLGLAAQAAPDPWQDVDLTATVSIANMSAKPVRQHQFRLTLPDDVGSHQKVLSVRLPEYPRFEWKTHTNQVDRYAQGQLRLEANSQVTLKFQVRLRLTVTDARLNPGDARSAGNANFLRPTTFVESSAPEIRALATRLMAQASDDETRLRAAFFYPQRTLSYRRDMDNRGALFALREHYGDCTEYAALFVATARAMGYPARLTSEFRFEGDEDMDQPNHHAAEVFLRERWIPVDPNLATAPKLGYGFGTTGMQKIVLKRDGSWVWASATPELTANERRRWIQTRVQWQVRRAQTEPRP